MRYEDLSDETKEIVKDMVAHCINQRACMGMDEGFLHHKDDAKEEVKHDFLIELEAFSKEYLL